MPSLETGRALDLLGPETDRLNGLIRRLNRQQWSQPSNLPGWEVGDLSAHVVRNGWSMLAFVQRALVGDPTPAFGPTVLHIHEEIKASGPAAAAERQTRETREFVKLMRSLTPDQLALRQSHSTGMRSTAWTAPQRVVEVAIHTWDLHRSLGQDGPLEDGLAAELLSFVLDPDQPTLPVPAPSADAEGAYRLDAGHAGSWLMAVHDGARSIRLDDGARADIELRSSPGWLILAIYGRTSVARPEFQIGGPADAAQRFAQALGGA